MIILGLGSNIGDRLGYLAEAVRRLAPLVSDMRFSRVLESAALLPQGAPPEWNQPYLNMAISGTTKLSPNELLIAVKAIERDMGRASDGVWGPRQIDIDILAMDDTVIATPDLTIPHREMLSRAFVLLPVIDVAPDWRYPAVGGEYCSKLASEIAAAKNFQLNNDVRDTGLSVHG